MCPGMTGTTCKMFNYTVYENSIFGQCILKFFYNNLPSLIDGKKDIDTFSFDSIFGIRKSLPDSLRFGADLVGE